MASRAQPQSQPPLWRETVRAGAVRSGALIGAIVLTIAVILVVVALASYHASDPSLNTASGSPAQNWLGKPGAFLADGAFWLLGPGVVLILPTVLLIALRLWRDVPVGRWQRMLLVSSGGAALVATTFGLISGAAVPWLPAGWGGIVGLALADLLRAAIALIGDPVASLWTARGIGALLGAGGIALWAYSFTIDMGERPERQPREPKRLTDQRDMAGEQGRVRAGNPPHANFRCRARSPNPIRAPAQ